MALNRNFYSFAVFTSGLSSAIYLIQAVIYLLIGQQIFTLPLFFPWYLFYNALLILGSLVNVYYFRFKKYDLPFWTMLLNVIAGVIPFSIFIGAFMGRRDWLPLYLPAEMIALATTIVFGLALIISAARERYWLKIAGIFFIVAGIALMAPAIWYVNSTSVDKASMLEQIIKWSSLFGCIGPLLVMMNFLDEQKQGHPENENPMQLRTWEKVMAALKPIAMLATLFFVLKLAGETVAKISWERKLALKTEQWDKVWGARTFTDAQGDTIRYQLIYPENLDSTKKYPMVVCLPYGGGIEGSPAAQFLLTEASRKKYPSFLFVPFCPNGTGWGGIPNYPTMDTVVFESIEAVENELNIIDANRVYVTGVSRGGYGSWHFISLRPDLFAAAMPVCGGGDPNLAANMVDVAVWAFHGEDDRNVPVSGSRDIIAAIKKSGGSPRYTEFPDSGHDIWHYVTTTPGVFEWLFEQKRE
ncbi:MAG TPA: hypothetical protein VK658_07370 [Chryseolinea sp.]|nr:hypothetical protein [Chryseolinea sp.]